MAVVVVVVVVVLVLVLVLALATGGFAPLSEAICRQRPSQGVARAAGALLGQQWQR